MKTRKQFLAAAIAFALSFAALASLAAPAARAAQDSPYGALERGYRTGYSDGYQSGWSDQSRGARADYRSKEAYGRADRAYAATFGSVEDYRDGYQQGFEKGYQEGYNRRGFDSNLPAGGVQRRGAASAETSDAGDGAERVGSADDDDSDNRQPVRQEPAPDPRNESVSTSRGGRGGGTSASGVSGESVMLVELQNRLSTDVSQSGDRFEARVLEPQHLAGAVVAGRLRDVQRAGKAKGRALLQLDFDQIQMPGGGGWQNFSAQVVEVLPTGGDDDTVGEVDPEGGVRGKSTTKDDVAKVGAATGIGAIIGGIAGGGKGAIIGAVIGGSAGGAGVMTQRGKDVRLERGQQLRIRASNVPR
ncbi:MAG TPA: hypothetical protein VM914_05545 [Pyrinomonadaceae bacterium]|jgi:hypothetical protein|nr:hypothetical protein [Pyrinomonadaceae bacterium]